VFDALSPQRRRLVVGAAIALVLLIMTVAIISVIRLIASTPHPVSQTDPGPVLLVPGYGGNVQSLEPLAEADAVVKHAAVVGLASLRHVRLLDVCSTGLATAGPAIVLGAEMTGSLMQG